MWFDGAVQVRRLGIAGLALGLVVGGVACGDDDNSSATTVTTTTVVSTTNPGPVGSASAELCQARDDLRTSISDLSKVDVIKNGTSAVTDQLNTIKDNLAKVRSSAGSDVKPQVDAFQQAVDGLQTALSGSTPSVTGVVSAVRQVATTGSTLLQSLGNLRC
jgi:hypothetical protein